MTLSSELCRDDVEKQLGLASPSVFLPPGGSLTASICVRPCETGHEDFKAIDSRDADWLIVRCSEGFDGGLPLTNYELEVYSEENVYHVNTIYLNHTDRSSSSGPVFEVPGLEPGRNYRLHLYAVNAKGRSDPVVLEPVTLKGVAMYTTGEFFLKPRA